MNIYVGNLPIEITEDELRLHFITFGPVTSVSLMNDKYIGSGKTSGYAFVEMPSKTEGEAAINSLQGILMGGRPVNVVEALPLSDHKHGIVPTPVSRFSGKRRQRVY